MDRLDECEIQENVQRLAEIMRLELRSIEGMLFEHCCRWKRRDKASERKFILTEYELTGIWIPTDAVMYVDSTRIENPRIKILFWWLEKFNFIANGNISYSIWFLLGEVTNNIGPENVTRNELRRHIPLPSRGCDIFWKAEQTGWIRITLHGINLEAYHD